VSTIIKDGSVAHFHSRIGHVPVLGMNETDVEDAYLIIIGMSKWRA
jgi:hypothetical protein